jgi:sulfur carrier protein ThiS adenylyltransferase
MRYETIFGRNPKGLRQFLKDKTVGIAGCGGLGSNLAVNLVRMGIGALVLADFDKVEASNLNRQQFFWDQIGRAKVEALKDNLLKINPGLRVSAHNEKLNPKNLDLFLACPVVAECFDCADQKAMLVTEMLCKNKYVVAVSGLAGAGSPEEIKIHFKNPNFILIGDEGSKCGISAGLMSARVSTAAAHQAWAVYYLLKEAVK